MGNNVSTPDCFVLSQLPPEKFAELLAEDFTVTRTSGEKQSGWRIPAVSHDCHEGKWVRYHAQVWDSLTDGEGTKKWRFHMVRDVRGEAHVCGWRPCEPGNRGFWPTRLTTPEEKEAWWAELDALVATLKRTRGMPDAEWFPLLDAQKEREDAELERKEPRDSEMDARRAFWTDFQQRLAERKSKLHELRESAAKDPAAQEQLKALEAYWGADDSELAEKLQKEMLVEKKDNERRAVLATRNAFWKELDDQEREAVERKDYAAAQRAWSQKQTTKQGWAEEDAKNA